MKIAIVNVQEFNPQIGGVERVSVSLARELIQLGVDVIFIARRRSPYSKNYVLPATQYILSDSSDYSPRCVEEVIKIIRDEKVDILLNQNAHSYDFNRECEEIKIRTGVKLVSSLHFCPDMRIRANRNMIDFRFFSISRNIIYLLKDICTRFPFSLITMYPHRKQFRHLYNVSDKIVLLSETFKKSFSDIACIQIDSRVCAINNMLSFDLQEDFLYKNKRKQILFCGRLTEQKNPQRVLYVWGQIHNLIKDWELVILGDGPLSLRMQQLCSRMKLPRVKFEGFRSPVDYYKESSIYLMTSNYEGWGLSLTEAMQFGCIPIVFRSYSSVSDIIDSGYNGFLIEPFSINAMSDCILKLVNNLDADKISSLARKKTEDFIPSKLCKQWLDLFNKLISD